jgi:hypothetical protein
MCMRKQGLVGRGMSSRNRGNIESRCRLDVECACACAVGSSVLTWWSVALACTRRSCSDAVLQRSGGMQKKKETKKYTPVWSVWIVEPRQVVLLCLS